MWEDRDFRWTVIFDQDGSFTASLGFLTVYVSPFADPRDLERRLAPVQGRLEAFAIGDRAIDTRAAASSMNARVSESQELRSVAVRCGATYICAAGEMQSPPLDWPHGGGEYIRCFFD
jgi:hypothetical protein